MPIISIFSGLFCREDLLVDKLVAKTGYHLVTDRDLMMEASRVSGIPVHKIERAFSSRTSVFNKFTHERERSIAHIKLTLGKMLKDDNLIIEGFSAQLIPQDLTHILRVCLIADMNSRLSLATGENDLPENEVVKIIHKSDEERALWVHTLFNIGDPWDGSLYDIVIPTDKMDDNQIVSLITENLGKDILRMTGQTQKSLDDFILSAEVEVSLVKEGHQVSVKAQDGHVTLTINKHVLMLGRLEDELKSLASRVQGVKEVTTKVGPEFHQADIYRKFDFETPSKILLVDDEREFVQTLSERLLMREMGSAVAYDGESALDLIKEDEPEVMILDLRMPGIDGIEVLKRVKKTNPEIEVIILTGHGSEADRETCMSLGAFAYLQKPVDIDELSQKIKEANEKIRQDETGDHA
jgi:CheY-like chemotaxis protein